MPPLPVAVQLREEAWAMRTLLARLACAALLAAAAATAAGGASAADKGKIDIDVVGADVRNVLRLFADVGHVNLVLGDEVTGTVTLRLKNVRWEVALQTTLAAKGLAMERRGNVVRVGTAEGFAKERTARLSAHEACLETAPLETRIIRVAYANADDLANLIRPSLTKRGSVTVDARTNTIIVRDVRCD
jgi:type IV pilus assembly protein PilQ